MYLQVGKIILTPCRNLPKMYASWQCPHFSSKPRGQQELWIFGSQRNRFPAICHEIFVPISSYNTSSCSEHVIGFTITFFWSILPDTWESQHFCHDGGSAVSLKSFCSNTKSTPWWTQARRLQIHHLRLYVSELVTNGPFHVFNTYGSLYPGVFLDVLLNIY